MAELFSQKYLSILKQFHLVMKRKFRGQSIGQRLTHRKGGMSEFADFKEYQPGDDLRFIDWNIFGRLEKLYIKLFHNEEAVDFFILLDCSSSMNIFQDKFNYALQLAGALGYSALQFHDRVRVFAGKNGTESTNLLVGGGGTGQLFHFLKGQNPAGQGGLRESLKKLRQEVKRPAGVFIISDFLFPFEESLSQLNERLHQVHLLQVLHPEELHPGIAGFFHLVDCENGEVLEEFIDPHLLDSYFKEMDHFLKDLEGYCHKKKLSFDRVTTDVPLSSFLIKFFGVMGAIA